MPSWPIHIAVANKVNEKLNLNDDFILGTVLPDVLDGYIIKSSNITDKNLSHFRINHKISLDYFLEKYHDKLNNPIVLGFLVHLITDQFYNNYTFQKHFLNTDEGMKIILNDGKIVNRSLETLEMKQYEYWKYGKKLALENKLGHKITFNDETFINLKTLSEFTYAKEDIENTTDFLNKWVDKEIESYDLPYKLYTEKELDKLFSDCIKFTLDYLNKLKNVYK